MAPALSSLIRARSALSRGLRSVAGGRGALLWGDLRHVVAGGPDEPPALGRTARQRRLVRIGLGVATFLLALLAVDNAGRYGPAGWPQAGRQVLWALSVAPLAVAAYRPLLAWRMAWVIALLSLLFVRESPAPGSPVDWFQGQVLAFLVVLLVVGTSQERGVLVWIGLASVGLAWAGTDRNGRVGVAILIAGLLLWGYLVQRRGQARQRLAEAQERGTVLTERARIARELHDVVAHHMSMIAVRTETAPFRLPGLPDPARAEFAEISLASREALTEMRRLLGVLRSDEPELPVAPQPGLADLPELVTAARAAGAEVTLDVEAGLPELPAAVDVSAYRIVQEALTNAARHAPGAPIRVLVERSGDGGSVLVSVWNGSGGSAPSEAGPGHGIRGMRERVAMLGGELRAAPTTGGGFEVSATLPLRTGE